MTKYRVPIDLIIEVDEDETLENTMRIITTLMYKALLS